LEKSPLEWLKEAADPAWITDLNLSEGAAEHSFLECSAAVRLPDGEPVAYDLRIERNEPETARVVVQECVPGTKLPISCPERHIPFVRFCMGWGPSRAPDVDSEGAAKAWWAQLAGFLDMQNQATLLRRWPAGMGWAHGHEAATVQLELESLLDQLGPRLTRLLQSGAFRMARWVGEWPRLEQRRQPCACGSGRALLDCHEEPLGRALVLQQRVKDHEAIFWLPFLAQHCCGSLDKCPRRRGDNR
jgi:hypothetical protein